MNDTPVSSHTLIATLIKTQRKERGYGAKEWFPCFHTALLLSLFSYVVMFSRSSSATLLVVMCCWQRSRILPTTQSGSSPAGKGPFTQFTPVVEVKVFLIKK